MFVCVCLCVCVYACSYVCLCVCVGGGVLCMCVEACMCDVRVCILWVLFYFCEHVNVFMCSVICEI